MNPSKTTIADYPQPLRSRFVFLATMVCAIAANQHATATALHVGNMAADRVLFLGNSITYHWPNADLGWFGSWGMAASSADKDYAHRVVAAIADLNGGTSPEMQAVNVYSYGQYEKNYVNYDVASQMASLLSWKPNIVVVELGENMDVAASQQADFVSSFTNVLTTFKSDGATVFVRNLWYPNAAKDALMKLATRDAGCVWVDLGDLAATPSNVAASMGIYTNGAVASHPSDKGMQAIADGLVGAMKSYAVPEPTACLMLASAALVVSGIAAKRRLIRTKLGDGNDSRRTMKGE